MVRQVSCCVATQHASTCMAMRLLFTVLRCDAEYDEADVCSWSKKRRRHRQQVRFVGTRPSIENHIFLIDIYFGRKKERQREYTTRYHTRGDTRR
jgi:hypothetical protein